MRRERLAVPDVIIGGAPRSGTTFLAEILAKHPGIFIPRPFAPEPKVCLGPQPDGASGRFARYRELFGAADLGVLRIEKTTNYFENEEARCRIAESLRDVKLIFMLREPVRRAYSNWLWSRKNGLETLPFEEAIRLEGRRPSPFPPERSYVRPFDYLARGRYGTLAEAWISEFERKRIAFYVFENALADPDSFVADVQHFLGVEPMSWQDLQTGRINATEPDSAGLEPALERELRARIAPEVRHFAALTGLDISSWDYEL